LTDSAGTPSFIACSAYQIDPQLTLRSAENV
jgi:hypothetical protein